MVMTTPLILQIQASAIDGKTAVSDTLRQAKLACAKLGLKDFGGWVDRELKGYPDASFADIPPYRKLIGTPQAFNPYQGWQDILFQDQDTFKICATAPVSTAVTEIELSLRDADSSGCFEFHYAVEQQQTLWKALDHRWQLRLKLGLEQCYSILSSVRNILTDWTIELETQGIMGGNLSFSLNDKEKSVEATSTIINNYHMGNVGALFQSADRSIIQGGVESSLKFGDIKNLADQIENQKDNLPSKLWSEIQPELKKIKDELEGNKRKNIIDQSLKVIGDICLKVGSNIAASGIAHVIANYIP